MIAVKELYWMQFSLRSKEPYAVFMHRKEVYTIYYPTPSYALCYRQTVGTGFIGYTKYKDKYITVLVTANHVIPALEDGKASRFAFENLLPDNKNVILKGLEIFTGEFWSSPVREVRMKLIDSKVV